MGGSCRLHCRAHVSEGGCVISLGKKGGETKNPDSWVTVLEENVIGFRLQTSLARGKKGLMKMGKGGGT